MKKLVSIIMISIFAISCVKKEVKKEEPVTPDISTAISTETVKTENLTTELIDETTEADVRKEVYFALDIVYFDFDKYELKPEYRDVLQKNAKIILENNYTVTIEGHCDERGTNQYNLSLGQKRANTVKEYYIRLGVPENKIATISYGEENPICFESNEECWAKNRRAESKVTK